MTFAPWGRFALALGAGISVAFAALMHLALVGGVEPGVGALLSVVPLALLALWAARRMRRHAALAVAGLALALGLGGGVVEGQFASVFFVEHAGANLLLGIVFGRTLAGGREPLCTTFARAVHGELPPEVVRYSRRVTIAWTLFFATIFTLSCILFLGRFLAAWSILANIATPVLVALMFVLEYFIRHRVLPKWERIGVLESVRAFARHFGTAHLEAPR